MTSQSEDTLEKELVAQLKAQGIEPIKVHNDEQLHANFKRHIERLNEVSLSPSEFDRLVTQVSTMDMFAASRALRDKIVLELDKGQKIYLRFMDTKDASNNVFEVTHQVNRSGRDFRFDLVILLNGLPVVHCELKKRGNSLDEAFKQINRYRQERAFYGLFRFVQLFVISNGVNTRYFANSDSKFDYSNTFHWTDEHNDPINLLPDFATVFLTPLHLLEMFNFYMNVPEKSAASSPKLTVLRPYQVYALKSIDEAVAQGKNGYIWHATGSGKTLTAFKSSQRHASSGQYHAVINLVDRKDLDAQTIEEFERYQPGSTKPTPSTRELVKSLNNPDGRPIITTIQKFARIEKELEDPNHRLHDFKAAKVLFIIDECHRSQFGDLHKKMRKVFPNAQYIGFTGTPILAENANNGRTTADIFGDCLHRYSMRDSIRDKNTLRFFVTYAKTVDYDSSLSSEELTQSIDTQELLHSPARISVVANDIIKDRDRNAGPNHEFTAILTVDRVSTIALYYAEFAKINAQRHKQGKKPYRVSTIFSMSDVDEEQEETEATPQAFLETVIADYNKTYNTGHSVANYDTYMNDARNRLKRSEIDIMIVVRMLLTGYDSEWINALYVDRKMKAHELIQAMSRTNRVLRSGTASTVKPAGHVRFYQTVKPEVDHAIATYSDTQHANDVLCPTYEQSLERLREAAAALRTIAPSITSVDSLGDAGKQEFIEAFKEMNRATVAIRPFVDFEFDEVVTNFSADTRMTYQDFQDYRSKYLDIANDVTQGVVPPTSVLAHVDFRLEELSTDIINVDYITALLQDLNRQDPDAINNVRQKNKDLVESRDKDMKLTGELIETFLDTLPNVSPDVAISAAFADHVSDHISQRIKKAVQGLALDAKDFAGFIDEYRRTGRIDTGSLVSKIGCSILDPDRYKKVEAVKQDIKTIANMYKVY